MNGNQLRVLMAVGFAAAALAAVGITAVRMRAAPDVPTLQTASGATPQAAAPVTASTASGLLDYFRGLSEATADVYAVQSGDTLTKIAKQYGVTTGLIAAANSLKSDAIFPGQKLKIMRDRWSLVIDKSRFTLDLLAGETLVKRYSVGLGKGSSTPAGEFKIASRLKNPTWYYGGKVVPFGNPENPLGTRWLGFDLKSYGVHGTIEPASIGKAESLGCVRMLNSDVEEIFELVPVGTSVRIVES